MDVCFEGAHEVKVEARANKKVPTASNTKKSQSQVSKPACNLDV